MAAKKLTKALVTASMREAALSLIWWRATTWEACEALAGITDRDEFWKGKTVQQATDEMKRMIAERFDRGEITEPR